MLGELAVKTLELRQSGVPLSKLMEVAEDNALLVAISIDAYKLPMFSSPVFIQEQKNEFRNAIELACYTAEAP